MSSNTRDDISLLLARIHPAPLIDCKGADTAVCNKAGILPFLPDASIENWRILVMKPVSTHPERGPPQFQLCKGTRMGMTRFGWRDIQTGPQGGAETESLAETALREGVEELGLSLQGICALYDAGPFGFTSVSTGKKKEMWMFAAEIEDENMLLPVREVAATTAVRKWMTVSDFHHMGREDHCAILRQLTRALAPLYAGYA
jgi:hypothetical protein